MWWAWVFVLCLGVIYVYMYVFKIFLSMYISFLVTIVQALLSLASVGHVVVVPRYYYYYCQVSAVRKYRKNSTITRPICFFFVVFVSNCLCKVCMNGTWHKWKKVLISTYMVSKINYSFLNPRIVLGLYKSWSPCYFLFGLHKML